MLQSREHWIIIELHGQYKQSLNVKERNKPNNYNNNCYMHSNANANYWRDTCRSPRQNKHMINSFINWTLISDKQNTNSGHIEHIEGNIYITNMNASV